MKKIFTITILVFAITLSASAQEAGGKIRGTVIDEAGKSIQSASISLLKSTDSSVVKLVATDKSGQFAFETIKTGRYLLSLTSVSHQTTYSDVLEVTAANENIRLKPITLSPKSKSLGTVTVTSKKPPIEQRPGMTILNVDASPTNTGLNALELLEKSPGVTVDNDGNISLKGKQGVLILLDGKPTYMSATDLAAYLKNMQSTNLEQIEIMTNPPAKYDAAGNSGIINIKTKKGNIRGMNGTVNGGYNQGIYSRFNGGGNVNYRNNKLNLFGGYNAGHYKNFNRLSIDRKFYESDHTTLNSTGNQVTKTKFVGTYQSFKAGMDYYFSKKDVAGFVVNGNFGDNNENPIGNSYIKDAAGKTLYRLQSLSNNTFRSKNISTNANYKHTFDSSGREISIDVDYLNYNNRNNSRLNTQSFNADDVKNGQDILLSGNIPSQINIYSSKVDYIHPFKNGLRLEAGGKTSFVRTNNQVEYLRNSGTGWNLDNRSNHFVYRENINAAYGILSRKIKKWDITAGLRLENTVAKGHQIKNDSTFTRNYTNLFPNLGIGFAANEKNQVNLSYSRRISRPNYDDLNPFVYFLDSLTYNQGNPYLLPQFTNNFELSHSYNRFLTTTVNYTRTTDIITQLLRQDTEKKITYQTRENISNLTQIGVAVMANVPVKKWWNTNTYVNVFNNHYNGIVQNEPIDVKVTSYMANITNSFTLGKGWNAEVSGWYRSKAVEGLLVINNMGALSSAVSKQVLKKKGTLKLSIRDMLYSQNFSGYAKYSDVDVSIAGRRDSRQVNLSFTYRFGKTNIPSERRKTGGANDEQNRVKSGGNN